MTNVLINVAVTARVDSRIWKRWRRIVSHWFWRRRIVQWLIILRCNVTSIICWILSFLLVQLVFIIINRLIRRIDWIFWKILRRILFWICRKKWSWLNTWHSVVRLDW